MKHFDYAMISSTSKTKCKALCFYFYFFYLYFIGFISINIKKINIVIIIHKLWNPTIQSKVICT